MEHNLKKQLTFFFCFLLIASLIYSPFLSTLSMIGLGLISILVIDKAGKNFKISLDRKALFRLKNAFQYPALLVMTSFFFIVLLSFWQTEHLDYWLERLRIKLPFILLPMAFIAFPRFSKRQIQHIFYFLLFLLLFTGIGVCINYVLHFEVINDQLMRGHPVPTPRNHIRLSLLVALGILGGIFLIIEKYFLYYPFERKLILLITLFLFGFIHLLSVRSGLLVLYAALLVWLIRYGFASKKYLLTTAVMILIASLPVVAYYLIPSFKNRLRYMVYDLHMYSKGDGGFYSDSGRIVSLEAGLLIAKAHPVFGVGAGNLLHEVDKTYQQYFPHYEKPLVPHNQFLFVLAGTGIAGLLLFCFAFFFPFFYQKNFQHPLLLGFYVIFFVAFMIEHTIENAVGVGTFSFFLLLLLNHLRQKEIPESAESEQ